MWNCQNLDEKNPRTIIWVKGFENDFELRWNMCVFRHLIL